MIIDWLYTSLFLLVVLFLAALMGEYMAKVFSGERTLTTPLLRPLEQRLYLLCGVDESREMSWKTYAAALLVFNILGLIALFLIQELQSLLPLNPAGLGAVRWDTALNTAVSFATNTNWQSYSGEQTMSYLTQMMGLTVQSFLSAAIGLAAAMALIRGFTRRNMPTIGNFWVDLTRSVLYVLLPLTLIWALLLASQGVVQTLSPSISAQTLEGVEQVIAVGPAASQIAIKQLGSNGGGFFNVNSAHPFENPTPLSNFLELLAILLLPASLPFAFGAMLNNRRQGWAIFAAMMVLFLMGLGVAGMVLIFNMVVGEVIFGGIGVGLISIMFYAIMTMFLAGLMVGRTPELLGKKLEPFEMIMAAVALLAPSITMLLMAGTAIVLPESLSSLNNAGPHGLSEILYAFASACNNNGSAFAGLNANTVFYNLALALGMLVGRFATILPALALAGSLASKKIVPTSLATFPVASPLFVIMLVGVVIIVGALTYFPVLVLGPILEQLMIMEGRTF